MRWLKWALSVTAGLVIYLVCFQSILTGVLIGKALGKYQPCSWDKLASLPWSVQKLNELKDRTSKQLVVKQDDAELKLQLIQSPTRAFWIQREGRIMDGKQLLAFVLSEQEWISKAQPGLGVRKGDVVVDVGAHIGTFGDDALRQGASKVVMVEPNPVNVECIRRNFKEEIASGKVVLVAEGAWNEPGTLDFHTGVANSGSGSVVWNESGAKTIRVPVRPLDDILKAAGIGKVDFIKMDIEGAERQALRGAMQMLKQHKPRLMMDMYHLEDDSVVLPRIIAEANPAYRSICASCTISQHHGNQIVPYATFFE